MSGSHRIRGRTTDEVFPDQCFLWERGASVGADFRLFNFQDLYVHEKLYDTLKEKGKKSIKRLL